MTFTKAFCVVLLLYLASYGECRCVKKDSKPEKRVVGGDQPPSAEMTALATQIAATLEQQVRQSAQDPSKRGDPHVLGGDQQFGFIYLQPALRHQFTLTNRGVETALQVDMNFKLNYHNTLWPRSPDNTNFRMAKVDYSVPDTHNDRHSEKQLLRDDGLRRMRRGCCPKFVLIYSTLLPCMNRPPENPPPPNPPEDRCLEVIGKAKTEFQNDCPNTYFFLYTHQNGPRNACKIHQDFFRWEQEYLTNNHINWLHP